MNIRTVQGKDAIRVHCNSNVKIVNSIGDLPGYGTVWYEPIGIANTLSMSRVTKKFRVLFDSEGSNFQDVPTGQVSQVQLSPNGLYYFEAVGRESIVLLINKVS